MMVAITILELILNHTLVTSEYIYVIGQKQNVTEELPVLLDFTF